MLYMTRLEMAESKLGYLRLLLINVIAFYRQLNVLDGDKQARAIPDVYDVSTGVGIPQDCVDKPWYANCELILEGNLCRHPYFSVFCCRSCRLAGRLL